MVIVIYDVKSEEDPTMRVTREKVVENRERIVAAASRLFREKGFDGVGVDAIMEQAGLTHGAFYRHFASKDALAAEAVARGLAAGAARQSKYSSLKEFVAAYLSPSHRDNRGGGCVLAALGGDVARQNRAARHAFSADIRDRLAWLAERMSGRRAAARRQAIATLSGLVGALVLARAVDDPTLSDEILAAARATFDGT
jgi:TetR/AcrR family transcriptional repressor of nem operon